MMKTLLLIASFLLISAGGQDFENSASSSAQRIIIPNSATVECEGDCTTFAMVKVEADGGIDMGLLSRSAFPSTDYQMELDFTPDDRIECTFVNNNVQPVSAGSSIIAGVYYVLTCTFNNTSNAEQVYINAVAGTGASQTDAPPDISQPVIIGNYSSGLDRSLDGITAQVRVYNRDLALWEIQSIANGEQTIVKNLRFHLPLWDNGTTFKDLSGNGNNGSCSTCPTATNDGPPKVFYPGGGM